MKSAIVTLEKTLSLKSLCHSCHYYDWDVDCGDKDGVGKCFVYRCRSALECTPGDAVMTCHGYVQETA